MAIQQLFRFLLFVSVSIARWMQNECVDLADNNAISSPNILCFYNYAEDLQPEQLNPDYCTHIMLYGSISSEFNLTANLTVISRLQNLKTKNPNLKILISALNANTAISQIVHSQQLAERFINQSIEYLTAYNLDGLDLDWEFPAWSGDPLSSRCKFPKFLKKFMEALITNSNATNKPRLLLTADVGAPLTIMAVSYDIPEIAKYVDFVNIMCYDFHFYIWYDPNTGSNAQLFQRKEEIIFFNTMNTAWAAKAWHTSGMPKSKINVGIPTYGHSYKLKDPKIHGLHAPASGPGMYGGWVNYAQACTLIKNGGTQVFDEESQVPYAYKDNDWISYDNQRSFISKTKHILDNEYAGIMIFSINSDDYLGICNQTLFPLIATVYNVTKNYIKTNK